MLGLLLGDQRTIDALGPRRLHAPALVAVEALNATRRLLRQGHLSRASADHVATMLSAPPVRLWPLPPLLHGAWQLRDELTAYDATYLVLADALASSTLVTTDRALHTRAVERLGADRVVLTPPA